MAPPCARCGGPTRPRSQFPDTFICSTNRDRLCGFVWERRPGMSKKGDDRRYWQGTVTTARGYLHWPLGPASWNSSTLNRVVAVVRPHGRGWPAVETVYDRTTIWRPEFDDPDSYISHHARDHAEAIIAALEALDRVA